MIAKMRERMNSDESGFTLVELLVVIIIIGILAAIAIPIFLNQQKTARDAATTSDVRNIATNIQSVLTTDPTATGDPDENWFQTSTNENVFGWTITVGDKVTHVSGTPGTEACAKLEGGVFEIYGFNTSGKAYDGNPEMLYYNSAEGGMQGAVTSPWDGNAAGPADSGFSCVGAGAPEGSSPPGGGSPGGGSVE